MKRLLIRFIIYSYVILLVLKLIPACKDVVSIFSMSYLLIIIGIVIYYTRYTRRERSRMRSNIFFVIAAVIALFLEIYVAPIRQAILTPLSIYVPTIPSIRYIIFTSLHFSLIIYCSAAICFPIRNKFFQIIASSLLVLTYYLILAQMYAAFYEISWTSLKLAINSFRILFIFAVVFHLARVLCRIQIKNILAKVVFYTFLIGNIIYILLAPLIG